MPEDSVIVHGDRQLLARAIVNLLNNAVKFSPDTSAVQLTCQTDNHEASVKITDEGPGVAPENAPLFFQRFTRGLHRSAADPGGAGLGLAFVRVVAEKHAGRVAIEDTRARGDVLHGVAGHRR